MMLIADYGGCGVGAVGGDTLGLKLIWVSWVCSGS